MNLKLKYAINALLIIAIAVFISSASYFAARLFT
jgi:hypothetical protein